MRDKNESLTAMSRSFNSKVKTTLKLSLTIVFLLPVAIIGLYMVALGAIDLVTEPSNTRDWNSDQIVLPRAEIRGDSITIQNIRNFSYTSTTEYTPSYYTKTYDLKDLVKVYYIVEPFSGFAGSAHTFLSFEFENKNAQALGFPPERDFLAVSVEIRKEKGEKFSALKGLFNQYELMYVLADERDAVKLRSNFRKDEVFVYPLKTTKEKGRELFIDILNRVNALHSEPEFYNTAINTCTTNIMRHANRITPKKVPWSYKVLLPAYSDELAWDLGILDTDLGLSEAREKFKINERALIYADDPNFSVKIRE